MSADRPLVRHDAEELDRGDPLAAWRHEFVDPGVVYLEGNSLSMAPQAAFGRIDEVLREQWAHRLADSWADWIDRPRQVGDRLAPLIGAGPGTVVMHDSTTVNLYQAVHAALGLTAGRRGSRAPVIAVEPTEFPTDRYITAGIAASTGGTVAASTAQLVDVDVVVRSLVDYRTSERADLGAETARAAANGTVIVWDLSHAAGAVEVDVTGAGVDLAVGCSYKYLNGGPGAPAWTYARADLQPSLSQPIWGWFSQRNQFEMDAAYDPQPDARRFLLGTPSVLGLATAEVGIGMVADAGITAIAEKGRRLTGLALALVDQFGLTSPTPRDPSRRGAHVAVRVERAELDHVHRSLADLGIAVGKRVPDLLRVGCSPLTTRFVDVFDALTAIATVTRP